MDGGLVYLLRKPSWLANYYDALNNRIRNLRDPSQAQDAATKGMLTIFIRALFLTQTITLNERAEGS